MIDFLMIIIFFGAVFSTVYFLYLEEDMDSSIQKRLMGIKEEKLDEKPDTRDVEHIYDALEQREQAKKVNILEMLKDQSEYKLPVLEVVFGKFKFTEKIRNLMKMADVKMPIDVFFMLVGLFIAPFLTVGIIINNVFIMLIGLISGVIPFLYLKIKFQDRLKKFSQHFPDSLGIISNSLRAGHSLLASFQMVANESPYPVNKLFKTVSDEISLGREVRETLYDMNNHMPESQDLKFFITAVLIQKEIGGNLAEILDTLNFTIREREKIQGLIKSQTAQAQLSGLVLGLAPVAIAILVSFINPQYMKPLFETTIGNLALFTSVLMSFTGFMIIRKITKIRI